MEKKYNLKEIEKVFNSTIECLEIALNMADITDNETLKKDKETVKYIVTNTAELIKTQVLERLQEPNTEEVLDMLLKIFKK